jgi:hypothetical protein
MRMPEPTVQRACCTSCASGGPCANDIRRDAAPGSVLPRGGSADASLVGNLGPGQPLEPAERAFFEPRFGVDFSAVRIHMGPQAQAAARALDARAYTVGSDITFASEQYRPDRAAGLRLLAHELGHVIQQRSRRSNIIRRQPDQPQRDDDTGSSGPALPAEGIEPGQPRSDLIQLEYAFVFARGDAYGMNAEAYIRQWYPQHILVRARSFEGLFDRLWRDVRGRSRSGADTHIREIVIVTHANAHRELQIPFTRSVGDSTFGTWLTCRRSSARTATGAFGSAGMRS